MAVTEQRGSSEVNQGYCAIAHCHPEHSPQRLRSEHRPWCIRTHWSWWVPFKRLMAGSGQDACCPSTGREITQKKTQQYHFLFNPQIQLQMNNSIWMWCGFLVNCQLLTLAQTCWIETVCLWLRTKQKRGASSTRSFISSRPGPQKQERAPDWKDSGHGGQQTWWIKSMSPPSPKQVLTASKADVTNNSYV